MRSRLPLLTMLGLIVSLVFPASGLAGGPQVTVGTTIGRCYLDGDATGIADNQLRIKHRAADGTLKATHQIDVTPGYYEVSCPGPKVESGDRFQYFEGDATTPFRTFRVPTLTLRTDRVADRITGTATRTTEVQLVTTICDPAHFGCTGFPNDPITVDPVTHRFSRRFADDVTGLWRIQITWAKGGDVVSLVHQVAALLVRPGSAVVGRSGPSVDRSVVVSARRGQSTGSGTARTKREATFTTTIRRNGTPMLLRTGDVVSSDIASDATFTVPPTNLAADGASVTGRCLKNRVVTVLLYNDLGLWQGWRTPTADADGRWEIEAETSPGWQVQAWCANGRGDAIRLDLTVD